MEKLAPYNEGSVRLVISEIQALAHSLESDSALFASLQETAALPSLLPPSSPSSSTSKHLSSSSSSMESNLLPTSLSIHSTLAGLETKLIMDHTYLLRNKQCLLAYHKHRLDKIKQISWDLGGNLSRDLIKTLSPSEVSFLSSYSSLMNSYKVSFLDVGLSSSLLPPKELYVDIRVLKDCGEILTETGSVRLIRDSQHYLKRTDVEKFIIQGLVQHV